MQWIIRFLFSSIGKKLLMALTGLSFVAFLCLHMIGNLTLYCGGDFFNSYASTLHKLGYLLTVIEWGLLFLALVHVAIGLILFVSNLMARPLRYKVNHWAGGRTISSATQPYSGLLILVFVVVHLLNFHFADQSERTIYIIVTGLFSSPFYVALYVLAMITVAFHVNHGFWSLFQTLGANHPKYMPAVEKAGTLLSIAFGLGFGSIPLFVLLFAQGV